MNSAASLEKNAVDKAISYIKGPHANLNPSCFYSGYTTHETTGQLQQAQHYITKHWIGKKDTKVPYNCRLILGVVSDFAKADAAHINDWSGVFKEFAESVSGKVYVLLGETIDPHSIWLQHERQALKDNQRVTEVEVWEIEGNGQLKKTNKTKATL
ncbi:hypothetical protein J132_01477 [Termitomyces sp. J132]|nr:hypothetical protein J132_01477 [Termitomyces sp. J132]